MLHLRDRIKNYLHKNNKSQVDLYLTLGFSKSKMSKMLNENDYQGWTYEELKLLIDKVVKDPEDRYYILTGEHLPESPKNENTYQSDIITAVKSLLQSVEILTHEVADLKVELRQLREEKKSQGRPGLVKVPDP